jgi:hypothetical protein
MLAVYLCQAVNFYHWFCQKKNWGSRQAVRGCIF